MRKVLPTVLLSLISSATFALSCPLVDTIKDGGVSQATKSKDGKYFVGNDQIRDAEGDEWIFLIGEINAISPEDANQKGNQALATLYHESEVEVLKGYHICRQYELSADFPYIPVAVLKSDLTK